MGGRRAQRSGDSTHLGARLRLPGHPGPQSWGSLGPREGEERSAGAKRSWGVPKGSHGAYRHPGIAGVLAGAGWAGALPGVSLRREEVRAGGAWGGIGAAGGTARPPPQLTFSPRAPFSPCEEESQRCALAGGPGPPLPMPPTHGQASTGAQRLSTAPPTLAGMAPPPPPYVPAARWTRAPRGAPAALRGPVRKRRVRKLSSRLRPWHGWFLGSVEGPGEDGDAHPGGQDLPVAP